MKRKKDITSYFCPKKTYNNETVLLRETKRRKLRVHRQRAECETDRYMCIDKHWTISGDRRRKRRRRLKQREDVSSGTEPVMLLPDDTEQQKHRGDGEGGRGWRSCTMAEQPNIFIHYLSQQSDTLLHLNTGTFHWAC
ncbi:hypothetical protein INR49_007051, partial [Caranx melampygus]